MPWRPIRERLRGFVSTELPAAARPIPRDAAHTGTTQNSLTRVESHTLVEIDSGSSGEAGLDGGSGGDDIDSSLSWSGGSDVDSDNVPSLLARPYSATAPRAGDLIEVSTNSWRVQLLAICLGRFRGVDHFYTNTGKWFASAGVRSLFCVTRFVSEAELAPVVAALPMAATEEGAALRFDADDDTSGTSADTADLDDMLNTLQDLKLGPSREAGAGLLKKMHAFADQAAGIHMAHAAVLDNAFRILRQAAPSPSSTPDTPCRTTYMTLDQLAAILLRREGHRLHGVRGHHRAAHHANHRHIHPLRNLPGAKAAPGSEAKDEFTAPAMYAVYRAVVTDELAFRPLTAQAGNPAEADSNTAATAAGRRLHSHSRSCLFAVAQPEDMDTVRDVEQIVRDFYKDPERLFSSDHPDLIKRSTLGAFVARARKAIDHSRQTRAWLPYGMLGSEAASAAALHPGQPPPIHNWTASDARILQFMHLWASCQRFSPSSRLHGIGSAVLRAMERYDDAEFLTMSTGWTFLQEVGWVAPWDIPARYHLGLPDVPPLRTGGFERTLDLSPPPPLPSTLSSSAHLSPMSKDIFAGKRRDWSGFTTYCIDAPDAEDIDDGIALERIPDCLDEFWIHVHVADPASRIRPSSHLAEQAARLPLTVYLPGYQALMFPNPAVRKAFSLAPNRPCLTFSARVNRQGAVLASAITPGCLGGVVFIAPDQVSAVVADAEKQAMAACNLAAVAEPIALDLPWTTASFAVGTPPRQERESEKDQMDTATAADARRMTSADKLKPGQEADLKTLAALTTALRAVRLANGAMPLYWPRPSVAVSLDSTTTSVVDTAVVLGPAPPNSLGSPLLQCAGDPYIRIWYEGASSSSSSSSSFAAGSRLVESAMRLAGEVAADWCHQRGIPVPFRGQPDAVHHLDRLHVLTRERIYPALVAGQRPSEADLRELRRLLGADDVTAVAVPHVTMGVPRYTKATSPLRRYADLLVHWQIEGALLAEMMESDARPDGETAPPPKGPPFSRSQMERDILPLLRVRERALRALDSRAGPDQWMLQALVRAWTGEPPAADTGNASSPPDLDRLRLTVTRVDARRGLVYGRLDWFERSALMEVAGLNPAGPVMPDVPHLLLDDVHPGQVYPVALAHVDVHANRVLVRRVGTQL